jgi:hypothetical protein
MAVPVASLTVWSVCFFVFCRTIAFPQIKIVLPGIYGFNTTPSLSFNGPAVDTALQNLRSKYPKYNWTSYFVADAQISSCLKLLENVQDLLSRWYYTQRDQTSLSLLVTPGMFK